MRPAVDGHGNDVSRWVETAVPEDAAELVSQTALDGVETGAEQFLSSDTMLFFARLPR